MKIILSMMLVFLLMTGVAQAVVYQAKLSPEQTEAIWMKSCRISLWVAIDTYGSKVTFPSKRDRIAFIRETCEKAKESQLADYSKMKTLSPEQHACLYISDRSDLIRGFEAPISDDIEFAFGYCNKK